MGIVVICTYKPKDGGEAELQRLLKRHCGVLAEQKLITTRALTYLKSKEGVYVEIFEWLSEDASRAAAANDAVQEIWGEMAQVCEFVPFASIEQSQTPFAHFDPFTP